GHLQVFSTHFTSFTVLLCKLYWSQPCTQKVCTQAHDGLRLIEMIRRQGTLAVTCFVCLQHTRIGYRIVNNMLCIRILCYKLADNIFRSRAENTGSHYVNRTAVRSQRILYTTVYRIESSFFTFCIRLAQTRFVIQVQYRSLHTCRSTTPRNRRQFITLYFDRTAIACFNNHSTIVATIYKSGSVKIGNTRYDLFRLYSVRNDFTYRHFATCSQSSGSSAEAQEF